MRARIFPNMKELVNKTSENQFFPKVDLNSAYHQVPMKEEDKQFTACEVQVKFHKLNCHIFGVSIAVLAFQKNIDVFVDQNMLERTYPYLDDVIIGGRSKEEHNMNVKYFAKEMNSSLHNISTASSGVCCKRPRTKLVNWLLHDSQLIHQIWCVPVCEYERTA